jgi:hypothetical protein
LRSHSAHSVGISVKNWRGLYAAKLQIAAHDVRARLSGRQNARPKSIFRAELGECGRGGQQLHAGGRRQVLVAATVIYQLATSRGAHPVSAMDNTSGNARGADRDTAMICGTIPRVQPHPHQPASAKWIRCRVESALIEGLRRPIKPWQVATRTTPSDAAHSMTPPTAGK